jgi:hypothetical protein
MKGGAIETLDSITISKIMGQGHEVCLADHNMNGNPIPCRPLNLVYAQLVIKNRYKNIKDEHVRNTLRKKHWFLFLDWQETCFN